MKALFCMPKNSFWLRLCRFNLSRTRLTRRRLDALCRPHATHERALVIHSRDIDHRSLFPNSFVIDRPSQRRVDREADAQYDCVTQIASGSYGTIVCTGLLEHVADPPRFVQELHRILQPGGRLIVSASAVFSFRGAPENYFHFTPHGYRLLFRDWSQIEVLRGTTRPFETIAVLLQRINLQCDIFPPARPLIEALAVCVRLLDRCILWEYDNIARQQPIDPAIGFMPATLFAVVIR